MNEIKYHHERNTHSLEGARRGLSYLIPGHSIASLLDIGAGVGNWLRAAQEVGVDDILGIDGVAADESLLCIDPIVIKLMDLRQLVSLGRKFDVVLCLEVAEHLPEESARILVCSICAHGDQIFFSAAAPGQLGEAHINCQWPNYWQALFNEQGFVCRDDVRFRMWNDPTIEPWYRQNLFSAVRDPQGAGREERIPSVVHAEMIRFMNFSEISTTTLRQPMKSSHEISHPLDRLRSLSVSVRRRIMDALTSSPAQD